MTNIIIARHGNTFDKGDAVTRVGARTDLPLSKSGKEQAQLLGTYLQQEHPHIAACFCSELNRTQETAKLALKQADIDIEAQTRACFNEIDYGPDENQSAETVITRIGREALIAWDEQAIVPDGWQVDPQQIQRAWSQFADEVVTNFPAQSVLVVTSNGIARFAPCITPDFDAFKASHTIKLSTGAVGCLNHNGTQWQVAYWNRKPKDMLEDVGH